MIVIYIIIIILLFIAINNYYFVEKYDENNDIIIKSYIIHLPDSVKRMDNINTMVKKLTNIPHELFDAFKGSDIDIDELKKEHSEEWITDEKKRRNEIGCYLSHREIIKNIQSDNGYTDDVRTSFAGTIIFEDDFNIVTDTLYDDIIKILNDINYDFDIIYLGNLTSNRGENIKNNIYKVDNNNDLWGTHAYLINNKNAPYIYNKIKYIDKPIDNKYETLINNNELKGYVIYPTLVNQQGETIKSDIR